MIKQNSYISSYVSFFLQLSIFSFTEYLFPVFIFYCFSNEGNPFREKGFTIINTPGFDNSIQKLGKNNLE